MEFYNFLILTKHNKGATYHSQICMFFLFLFFYHEDNCSIESKILYQRILLLNRIVMQIGTLVNAIATGLTQTI